MSGFSRLWLILLALTMGVASEEDLRKLYQEAQTAQSAGDLAGAARRYEAIVRLRPDLAEAYSNLGNLYYQLGRAAQASAVYRKAIELKPQLAGPHFFLGVIAFNQHEYAAALLHLNRAVRLEPSNALIHSYLGYTYYAQESYGQAARALEEAADLEGGNIDVFYLVSKSYGHLAKDAYNRLQRKHPDSAFTYLARAHFQESEQNWKSAAEQYRLASQKMPGNTRVREKEREMARRSTGEQQEVDARHADELVDGSLVYLYSPPAGKEIGREIASRRAQLRALEAPAKAEDERLYRVGEGYQTLSYLSALWVFEIDPQSYRAHQIRAQLLENTNKQDEAIAEYRRALELKPDLQNIHFAIGSLYWKDQHFDRARVELESELKLNPSHPQALYELGDILVATGKPKEAESLFLKALKVDPKMAEAHFALEKIYTETGQYAKAVEHLRTAMEIDQSDPTPHYRLAAIYRKMGRNQEAESELKIFSDRRAGRGKAE